MTISKKKSAGSILIVSLWMLAIFSVISLGLFHRTRIEMKLTQYHWDEINLVQIAKGAVAVSLEVLNNEEPTYTALNQRWNHSPEDFFKASLMNGNFTLTSAIQNSDLEDHPLYGLEDEERRINLNRASLEILKKLFSLTPEVVETIMDWRDADDQVRPQGAESQFYASLNSPYQCRNAPLESTEELLLIRGITPEVYHQVKDLITVYGSGKVNLNTAHSQVLSILGFEESLIEKIMEFRRGGDQIEGSEDDGVFTSLSKVESMMTEFVNLTPEERLSLKKSIPLLTLKSEYFRLNLSAHLNHESARKRFLIVVKSGSKGPYLQSWLEI